MVACTLPPSLTLFPSSPYPSSSTPRTTSTAHPYNRIHIPRACTQRELASHILRSPFTIASSTLMADHHQQQHATYQYVLDGTGISIDSIENSSHSHRDQIQSDGQGQGQSQMSPPNSASTHGNLMYHPYAHAHHPSYASAVHQSSSSAFLNEAHQLTLDPAQLRTSSVGPSRVLTRRQARMAAAHACPNTSQGQQQRFDENFGLFGGSANSARPQTPSSFHVDAQPTDARIGMLDLNIGQITVPNASALSPQHPSTPASVTSSNFSHYDFAQYAPNGHSRSGSSSTHPRSTSPAASVVSAATSLSSGSNPKSGRSRPPVSTGSAGCISVSSYTPTPTDITAAKPKRRLQNKQRKEICQYYIEHPNSRQEDIAARWGVERSTVSKILKHKNRWMMVSDGDEQVVAKHRPAKFADVEGLMYPWLVECRDSGVLISDAMIRAKARECAHRLDFADDKFKASAGWVENYKHRANIKKGVWIGRPLPGIHEDDDTDDDRPLVSDLADAYRRANALREADEGVLHQADGLEPSVEGPGMDLGASSVILGNAGDWPPSLSLSFDNDGTTNTSSVENHVNGMNNSPNEANDIRDPQIPLHCQASTPFRNEGGLLQQQHIAATRAAWAPNGRSSASNFAGGLPPVSAQDASSAMDTVLRFLQTQPPEFLNEQMRNIVTDIKHLIWVSAAPTLSVTAAANSVPAGRSSITAGVSGNANAPGGSVASGAISTTAETVSAVAS